MELFFGKNQKSMQLFYGETLPSLLLKYPEQIEGRQILFLTNQAIYDGFSEKVEGILSASQRVDWYICGNDKHVNQLPEWQEFLRFFAAERFADDFLLVGFGNEGVCQMALFFHETSLVANDCWLVPTTVTSLSKAMTGVTQLELRFGQPVMQLNSLPTYTFYDNTLMKAASEDALDDLFVFIQAGMVLSYRFLQNLFRNFGTERKVKRSAFTALLEELVFFYQKDSEELTRFGVVFKRAAMRISCSHLLSTSQRQVFGVLMQLLWSQARNDFAFHTKNFFVWLTRLGYDLRLPADFSVAEYVEAVLEEAAHEEDLASLAMIGQIGERRQPEMPELLKATETYLKYIDEIRGNQDEL